MQEPGPSYLANTEDLATRYESTGPLSSGHNAGVGQEQHIIESLHSNNKLERRRILREVGLEDSDDDEANGTLQPQVTDQNPQDTLRTRFSGNEPGAESNHTAVCHAKLQSSRRN